MSPPVTPRGAEPPRREISIRGTVQGVGFRPYAYGLAIRLRLRSFIKNVSGGVIIEPEGASSAGGSSAG